MSETAIAALVSYALFSSAGWILLFYGIRTRREYRRKLERERSRAAGRIVEYAAKVVRTGRRMHGRRTIWIPVVEFDAEGRRFRLENAFPMDREAHPVGEAHEVLYDPDDPTRFHLEADQSFADGGRRAICAALIWLVVSAALTCVVAVVATDKPPAPGQVFRGR